MTSTENLTGEALRALEAVAPILVLSNVILDDIVLADGTNLSAVLGGAATYAAVGARFWWPLVAIVAGVGGDLEEATQGRLGAFGLRQEGLVLRGASTIRSRLVYGPGGDRRETPVLGHEHFDQMQVTPRDIPDALLPAAGAYVFRDLDTDFWLAYDQRRSRLGVTCWELQGSAARMELWPAIRHRLPMVDMFSLNLAEANRLLGTSDPSEIADRVLGAGCRIFVLRMGGTGALIADAGRRLRLVPPGTDVVDVTGAGNGFCGGFLAGWLRTSDLAEAGRAAAAAAARCLSQFGPPDPLQTESLAGLSAATRIEEVG